MAGVKTGGKKWAISVTTKGFNEAIANLQHLKKSAARELQKVLVEEAEEIKRISQSGTPIKTGRLHDSTRVSRRGAGGGKGRYNVSVAVIVGGISVRGKLVNYATVVHETHPTKSHFLLKALQAREKGFENRVRRAVDELLRKHAVVGGGVGM